MSDGTPPTPSPEALSAATPTESSGTADSSVDAADLAERAPENRKLLERLLREEATGFEFFQAVRLLERIRAHRAPIGGFHNPSEEVARFRVPPSLAFPPAQIRELDLPRDPDERAEVEANFMGLVGPLGVLPHDYTLLVAAERSEGAGALGDFLNLFEHRLISLFYRAWKKHRVTVDYEEGDGSDDAVTRHLFDFVGQGLTSFRGHLPVDERTLLFYTSLLVAPQRGAAALEQWVSDYFGVPVEVKQFVGQWHPLAAHDQCALDEDATTPSTRLGGGATVGDEVWDLSSRVRLRIGPVDRETFESFLPGRDAHAELQAMARFYGQGHYDFEVQLVLERDRVPAVVLGEGAPGQLGWSTWVRSAPFDRDADDTVLTL